MDTQRYCKDCIDSGRDSSQVDLGLLDEKGRAIGLRVSRYRVTYRNPPQAGESGRIGCWYIVPEGFELDVTYWAVNCQVTRNGRSYGASQPRQLFKSEAEREAFIAKRIKTTRARYQQLGQAITRTPEDK